MVKQREGYKIVVPKEYTERIDAGLCPVCSRPQSEWQRSKTWRCCSVACTKEYGKNIFWGWPSLRRAAIKRDGKCLKCGVIHTFERELTEYDEYYREYEIILSEGTPYKSDTHDMIVTPAILLDMSKYVVDHIHAIALGGEEWDINNLQTLCIECNKGKTKIDAGKIARLRFKEELTTAGQKFLDEHVPNQNI